jgi:hypothetical protein
MIPCAAGPQRRSSLRRQAETLSEVEGAVQGQQATKSKQPQSAPKKQPPARYLIRFLIANRWFFCYDAASPEKQGMKIIVI